MDSVSNQDIPMEHCSLKFCINDIIKWKYFYNKILIIIKNYKIFEVFSNDSGAIFGVLFIFNLSKSNNYMSREDSFLDNGDKSVLFLFPVLINLKLSVSGAELEKCIELTDAL